MNREQFVTSALLAVHLAIVAVVLSFAGTAATTAILSPPSDADGGVPAAFDAGDTALDTSTPEGTVTVATDGADAEVVLDLAHGNDQTAATVQTLERLLVENGYTVRYHRSGRSGQAQTSGPVAAGLDPSGDDPDLNASLSGADAYVIVNPSEPYGVNETAGLADFVDTGGRVLIMSDPDSIGVLELLGRSLGAGGQRPPDALAPVSSRFGVGVGEGYLYNMEEYDANHQTIYATGGEGRLGADVDRVSLHRAAPIVAGPDASMALTTDAQTELSTSSVPRSYGVAARNGDVAIVGDTSILDPARLHHADNEVFVGNLVEFLVAGSEGPGAVDAVPAPAVGLEASTSSPLDGASSGGY